MFLSLVIKCFISLDMEYWLLFFLWGGGVKHFIVIAEGFIDGKLSTVTFLMCYGMFSCNEREGLRSCTNFWLRRVYWDEQEWKGKWLILLLHIPKSCCIGWFYGCTMRTWVLKNLSTMIGIKCCTFYDWGRESNVSK